MLRQGVLPAFNGFVSTDACKKQNCTQPEVLLGFFFLELWRFGTAVHLSLAFEPSCGPLKQHSTGRATAGLCCRSSSAASAFEQFRFTILLVPPLFFCEGFVGLGCGVPAARYICSFFPFNPVHGNHPLHLPKCC